MEWITADLHLGHGNIIKYCNRPFNDVNHMNVMLVNNWNSVVSDDDVVFVLGDLSMGNKNDAAELYIPMLKGYII